jgi:hypothetical protein
LGCKVESGPPGRADLILRWRGRTAVVEVKGLTKSAKEANAAQLEKWVSAQYEEEGEQPKGILVVNTYAKTDLKDRTRADFPDQMLPYSIARGHCLITGLQLLAARLDAELEGARRPMIVGSLFDCIGIYDRYRDWDKWIKVGGERDVGAKSVSSA